MQKFPILSIIGVAALLAAGCATQTPVATTTPTKRICKVRTTAYTHAEKGGGRNAIGTRLSSNSVKSAAADWSRWPLGTKFRIVGTDEVFQIDDYGSALIGTGTIDLYKTNRLQMNQWGVRKVDIDVIEWGSPEHSLEVLTPRAHNRCVRQMILALSKKPGAEDPLRF
jgi:3D (Asp-Asp-Asp) domain-containing protein